MPAAVAIPLILGGAAAGSGFMKSRAAGNAADTLADGADVAGSTVQNAINQYSPRLLDTATTQGQRVIDASNGAADDQIATGDRAAAGVNDAAAKGNDLYKGLYDDFQGHLDPYRNAGADAIGKLSELGNEKFSFSQNDPSYQWRLQQGQRALERSRAAVGGLQSGAALKALTGYAQGMASTEYGKEFDRFIATQKSKGDIYSSLAGFGERANGQDLVAKNMYGQGVNSNNMTAAKYAGDVGINTHQYGNTMRTQGQQYFADAYRQADGNDVSNQLGGANYRANTYLQGKGAIANGQIASGNAWANTIADVGKIGAGAYGDWSKRPRTPRAPSGFPGDGRGD